MARLLLDTHIVLWDLDGTRPISERTRSAIESADELLFSAVSYAEIGIKIAVGKLSAPADLGDRLRAAGVRTLGLGPEHGLATGLLPLHHRDPFDRLLIAQAQTEQLTLVSADPRIGAYDVPWLDARL